MGHFQNNKPDPPSQDHQVPLTYCKIACEATDIISLSISRRVVLERGGSGTADDDASHLLFFGFDFVEHSFGTGYVFRFREPKTGIEVPEFVRLVIE